MKVVAVGSGPLGNLGNVVAETLQFRPGATKTAG
jgi:hypothetical protein